MKDFVSDFIGDVKLVAVMATVVSMGLLGCFAIIAVMTSWIWVPLVLLHWFGVI